MLTMVDNAAKRGEVNPAKITPRIASLPLDLVRHHMFVTHVAAPEDVMAEIVDDVFLPLVRV